MKTISRQTRPARILLAEDDRTIARLIDVALSRTGILHDLQTVHDGEAALIALGGKDLPDLMLLDIHMPGKNGFEVLAQVKENERLRRIPVVMFSSSGAEDDVSKAYDLHANAYVQKNPNLPDLSRTIDAIVSFWLRTAVMVYTRH
jgi:CheY-like chemotaxis protein